MIATKLTAYLDAQGVPYEVIEQPGPVYTAQEIAAAAHISGKQLVKTVMLWLDGELVMAVLPAAYRVNLARLQRMVGAKQVKLASEAEFRTRFPGCQAGAMPPFGNLYELPVYAAQNLADQIEIAFCAGSHTELVRMALADFIHLVQPEVLDFAWLPA